MKEITIPVIEYSGKDFFFVGRYVMVRNSDSHDDFEDFIFPGYVNGIGLEVLLINGEKYIILGGPDIHMMYATLYQAV